MKMTQTVQIKLEVDMQRLADLWISGLEGGIGYWARYVSGKSPFSSGEMVFFDKEEERQLTPIGIAELVKGLQVMAEKYPRHFSNWLQGNEDAETGDVFIQCAAFGETVYG